uniref:Exocyst subunit Exo70 family protein n=1 Tax=Salix viminalis TaxID=40686 RepID=A0A6N2N299_SALVM
MLSRKPMWRKKFRSFYHGFEKVCRAQTACSIPDDQLREDLRNSISLKVNHAYQKFVERDTDQNCLLQLFKGSQIKIIAQPC